MRRSVLICYNPLEFSEVRTAMSTGAEKYEGDGTAAAGGAGAAARGAGARSAYSARLLAEVGREVKAFKIRDVEINPPLVLSPMAGVDAGPFRGLLQTRGRSGR